MVKKKIYTLTCTWPRNYGAVLQAYALVKFLRNEGYEAQTLNYKPDWWKDSVYNTTIKKILRPVAEIVSIYFGRPFIQFLKDDGVTTEKVYHSNNDLVQDSLMAEAFIVGSDQVWNCTKYYNGRDDAMFLDFAAQNQKRISYAASLAMPDVPEEQAKRYRGFLDKFDAISVREKTGEVALRNIGVEDVETVIDPVYLVSRSGWLKLANKSKIEVSDEQYVLVICLEERSELYEYARAKANMLGVKLYSFRGGIKGWKKHSGVDRNFWNISVYDYLNLVRNAKAVVTDSFHATSFSLIFNRDVDVILRNDQGNSRMADLLDDLDIPERITTGVMLNEHIDYTNVNTRISVKVKQATEFLNAAIRGDS